VRLQLVVNPSAGGGRAARLLPRVRERLSAHDLVVSPTRSLEHADELAAAAVADARVVLAMGGDGIVGRVAGAVADGGGLLAVLPGGRGNDFARAVGVPRDPVAACDVVEAGVETAVDLGVAGGVPFLGIASVGFDSAVQERVLRSRVPLGQLVYVAGALATVASWRHATFDLVLTGQDGAVGAEPGTVTHRRVHGWAVAVANSGVYGGGMRLAPDASVTDGVLDVVLTSATSRTRFLRSLPRVFSGTHVHEPSVEVLRAGSVRLSSDRPFRVFADGDPVAALPCVVTVRPGALRVLLPAASR
jgi:YegS/Rv2252/BmrU family lipid kinase